MLVFQKILPTYQLNDLVLVLKLLSSYKELLKDTLKAYFW